MRTTICLLSLWTLLIGAAIAQEVPDSPVPPDTEIKRILAERIDTMHQGVGIVVGVIEPKGRRIVAYGALDQNDKRPLDGNTVFEIGSVTKVFTSLLLADMAEHGEVALNDPVEKYLPPEVRMPERSKKKITLVDLSTHTSGLPTLPSNIRPKDAANPYADYTLEQLYKFLSSYSLMREVGAQFEYSNLGGGLLGVALTRRSGFDYETMVRTRIADPLGMKSTGVTPSPDMKARLAVGHDSRLSVVENWDFPTLPGAGALRSTANDLLTFLEANLGYKESPLATAMASMLKVRRPAAAVAMEIGLGWLIARRDPKAIVWHNGGTGGYRTFVGFDPKARIGVVVLSNTMTPTGVDDIGLHLLDSRVELIKAPKTRKEISVDPKVFDGYVGRYQVAENFFVAVTREGVRFFVQPTGQPKIEIFAESDRNYFMRGADAQVIFETDAEGKATSVVLHVNGQTSTAKRIE